MTEIADTEREKKYFHIAFYFKDGSKTKELEPIFESMSDVWMRYFENCWIVRTSHTSEELLEKLKPFLKAMDQVVILELVNDQTSCSHTILCIHMWLKKDKYFCKDEECKDFLYFRRRKGKGLLILPQKER